MSLFLCVFFFLLIPSYVCNGHQNGLHNNVYIYVIYIFIFIYIWKSFQVPEARKRVEEEIKAVKVEEPKERPTPKGMVVNVHVPVFYSSVNVMLSNPPLICVKFVYVTSLSSVVCAMYVLETFCNLTQKEMSCRKNKCVVNFVNFYFWNLKSTWRGTCSSANSSHPQERYFVVCLCVCRFLISYNKNILTFSGVF